MNIDLFLTGQSEAGIVCDGVFPNTVVGIILDAQTHELTLEFPDGDTYHLNIPMEASHKEKLLYLNDPYGSDFGQNTPLSKPKRSVIAFEQFMKRCNFAQGLHRDNLGDEEGARSVLRGLDPNALQYAPTLQRQLQMNIAPKTQSAPQSPGLGGSANRIVRQVVRKSDEDED